MTTMQRSLAGCHGFLVVGTDGACGAVETPLFPPDRVDPDFLIVRTGGRVRPRFRVVSTALVEAVDGDSERVLLRLSGEELRRLPEHLPLAL
jgi:hypothetical protein